MSNILLVGDAHANLNFMQRCMDRARLLGCEAVVQLGDFGAHWTQPWSQGFTAGVKELCAVSPVPLYWLRGNHDSMDAISVWTDEHGHDAPIEISKNYYYLPDGLRWKVGQTTIGVLGGEFSVDWRDRHAYISWWPEELPTPEDVERLGTEHVDLLLTHGPPELPDGFISSWTLPPLDQDRQDVARILIRKAIRQTTPKDLVHGHPHRRYQDTLPYYDLDGNPQDTFVMGLAHDDDPFRNSVAIYDTVRKDLWRALPTELNVER